VLATSPMLGRASQLKREHEQHLIYFGHLRHWEPSKLARRLADINRRDQIDQLAAQLVAMSKRNWTKHQRLRMAMISGMTGVGLLGTALLIAR